MKLQVHWQEASTKRGLALLVAGGLALGQLLSGDGWSWTLLTQDTFWLALGTLISGVIGLCVPDRPDPPEPLHPPEPPS